MDAARQTARLIPSPPLVGELFNLDPRDPHALIFIAAPNLDERCVDVVSRIVAAEPDANVVVFCLAPEGVDEFRLAAVEAGAEDVIQIPLTPAEYEALRTRLMVISTKSRRVAAPARRRVLLEPGTRAVSIGNDSFVLTSLEFGLFQLLYTSAPSPVSYEDIERSLWGSSDVPTRQTLRQLVRRLRGHLGRWSSYIGNAPGFGYVMRL
jgi:DNA-binding response OmpR family regulator